jgi:hypothetical protein
MSDWRLQLDPDQVEPTDNVMEGAHSGRGGIDIHTERDSVRLSIYPESTGPHFDAYAVRLRVDQAEWLRDALDAAVRDANARSDRDP